MGNVQNIAVNQSTWMCKGENGEGERWKKRRYTHRHVQL